MSRDKFFPVACMAVLYGTQATMFITFLLAYVSPAKEVSIAINNYGEAHIELIMMLFAVFVAIPVTFWAYLRKNDILPK